MNRVGVGKIGGWFVNSDCTSGISNERSEIWPRGLGVGYERIVTDEKHSKKISVRLCKL